MAQLARLLRGNHTPPPLTCARTICETKGAARRRGPRRQSRPSPPRPLVQRHRWRRRGGALRGLAANTSLQILDLGDNQVGEGLLALKDGLLANMSLHTLGLANASLGEEGGVAMAEVIEGNSALQRAPHLQHTSQPEEPPLLPLLRDTRA